MRSVLTPHQCRDGFVLRSFIRLETSAIVQGEATIPECPVVGSDLRGARLRRSPADRVGGAHRLQGLRGSQATIDAYEESPANSAQLGRG